MSQGKIVIPLREEEVRTATKEIVEAGSKAIVICLLQSHKNESSEQRARDIVKEELKKLNVDIPVFASVDYYPSRKESHRMNTTILEAYGAEPSRQTLKKVSDRFKKHGAKFDLRVMATHGGTISWKAKELARTIVSGPIGGVIGSKLLGECLGDENIACSDIGGTSFDVALITKGNFAIQVRPRYGPPVCSRCLWWRWIRSAPVRGSFVRLDPYSKSIKLGPDSAGYRVGTLLARKRPGHVSVSDCHVVLGYLNPNNFLGVRIKLDVQRAPRPHQGADRRSARTVGGRCGGRRDRVARSDALGIPARQHQRQGLQPGGVHVFLVWRRRAGAHLRLHRRGGFPRMSWCRHGAAGFSAFGCACADFEYRYDKSVDLGVAQLACRRRKGGGMQVTAGGLERTGGQGDRGVRPSTATRPRTCC
jgi:acetone carboxylase beta subunit